MTREDDYWTIVSGGRAEARRRRLEHRDRIVSRVYTLLAVLLLLGGLAIICTPPLNQWVTDGRLTATAQAAQVSAATATDTDTRLEAADEYNRRLAAQQVQIGVELPIRHGTGADVLDDGLGHVHGTSLPVGGKNTRTVISGHTNMEGRTLFTRLDELRKGQTFTIGVYGRVLHYRITGIRITSPKDTDALRIQPGRDLATLVTCTDTGNSRRLLVTGERYTPTPSETRETDSKTIRDGALACCGITFLAGLAVARRDTERLCRHTDDVFRPKEHRS